MYVISRDTPIWAAPVQTRPRSAQSLGAELERDRLQHRVRTTTVAIRVLRQRASEQRRRPGGPPRHLGRAIADFETQLAAMNVRLRDLAPERTRRR
jgi:hypothetical protein